MSDPNFPYNYHRQTGSASADNALLFSLLSIGKFNAFTVLSHQGSVDVEVTLDGINWTTTPVVMQDFGAVDGSGAISTQQGRLYGMAGRFEGIRLRQVGAGSSAATLLLWQT